MNTTESGFELPTWVAGLVLLLVAGIFLYGIVVMQSILAPFIALFGLLGIALSVFVVYLLYRFVVAFEKIAEKY